MRSFDSFHEQGFLRYIDTLSYTGILRKRGALRGFRYSTIQRRVTVYNWSTGGNPSSQANPINSNQSTRWSISDRKF
jgi:hypothetical protein